MSGPLQLDPPIYLETPLGGGWAYIYENCGVGLETFWTVALDDGGACVLFRNDQIRFGNSYTAGRWNPGIGKKLQAGGSKADKDMRRLIGRRS